MNRPASGIQMYLQRVEGLKVGRTYTLLPPDSFKSVWEEAIGQPTYQDWTNLLAWEARALAKGQGSNRLAILLGDSISMWFPPELMPPGRLWLNQGISGDNTSGILKRLWTFSETKPHTIYILAGINDLRQGRPDASIADNIYYTVRELQLIHPPAKVVVQSILPTRLAALPNTRIRKINLELAAISKSEGAIYFDLNSAFTNNEDRLHRELTTDGIHLSQAGYQLWQKALHQMTSRLDLNRDNRYQQWLQRSPSFTLDGKIYTWVSYQVQPGDSLPQLSQKAFGFDSFEYWDLIALKNNLGFEEKLGNRTILIPQTGGK
jgi:lysophospholipase L1-like esterase